MTFKNKFPKAIVYILFITFSLLVFQNCSTETIDTDPDNDGISGTLDNCPTIANLNQLDNDNDGLGDACDDDDDNDGILDVNDNCPFTANPDQEDTDSNGVGNVCETNTTGDNDDDGVLNGEDNCPDIANPDQEDTDDDGMGDACDDDDDNDGILDVNDNCPLIANPNQEDFDNDGIGNLCDEDYTAPISPCEGGMAGIYPCDGYDLMAHIDINTFGTSGIEGNDSWGWTDPTTGKEYALVGTTQNTSFVDITDTQNLVFLGTLPTATGNSLWRDIKVYNNYAFIVSEASGHGMQVFDLTRLRNVTNAPETFTADAHYTGFGRAHNIFINEDSGYAYIIGTYKFGPFSGNTLFLNVQDPLNPTDQIEFTAGDYSHDAQIVTYNGPDTDHTGKELYIGSNENEITIVDVTDKNNPIEISTVSYTNIAYTHQGWFTEDLKYFIVGDEIDERDFGNDTRTLVFDFTDLDNPILSTTYFGPTAAIDHNGYVKEDTYYLANYTAGVRFIDISDIDNGNLTETGFFDTYPADNSTNFNGVWNVYPFFESGNIIINDIDSGLFIVRKSGT